MEKKHILKYYYNIKGEIYFKLYNRRFYLKEFYNNYLSMNNFGGLLLGNIINDDYIEVMEVYG
jgi:hypothetical protein